MATRYALLRLFTAVEFIVGRPIPEVRLESCVLAVPGGSSDAGSIGGRKWGANPEGRFRLLQNDLDCHLVVLARSINW